MLTDNPAKSIKLFREDNQRTRYLSEKEFSLLLAYANKRLKPILELAVYTGMRLGEIQNLKWPDIDFESNVIVLKETKSNRIEKVPINTRVKRILKSIPRQIQNPWVFCLSDGRHLSKLTIQRDFKKAVTRAGIQDIRFHDLRHTCASWLVMRGVDLRTVQGILRHRSFQMTLRYAHLAPVHKLQAVEKLVCKDKNKTKNIFRRRFLMDTNMDTKACLKSKTEKDCFYLFDNKRVTISPHRLVA